MSSSDDDAPLLKGRRPQPNGVKSTAKVPQTDDKSGKMNGHVQPAVSIRNGPVEMKNMNSTPKMNGTPGDTSAGKRKSRPSTGANYKDPSSSEDEDLPLSKKQRKSSTTQVKPPKAKPQQMGESSDSDVPLGKKLAKEKKQIEKHGEKVAKPQISNGKRAKKEDSDDEDAPLAKRRASSTKVTPKQIKQEVRPNSNTKSAKPKVPPATPDKEGKKVKQEEDEENDEEDEEEETNWWDAPMVGDGTKKWTTLEHSGVVFPPEYEPLPKNVKMEYDGIPITLPPGSEEVAYFYGSMLNSTVNVENPTFNKNFFVDFRKALKEHGHGKDSKGNVVEIKEFKKCNFKPIWEHVDAERIKKNSRTSAEKKAAKAEKEAIEAPYMYCMWDGKKQKVGNFRVEPPGLFRGRGEHPKTGMVKQRVRPEQVTINIGKKAKVPSPPPGHRWKEVKHDNEGTWLAMWQENINGNYKYVMLAANSDIKGQSDYKKFEKARELSKYIAKIRKDYMKNLRNEVMADRQMATAVYLIDQLALRAGNEKAEDEADTVGCCSLKFEHVTLKPPKTVIFDFLGKDSIRFYNEVEVDEQVFKNLRIFKKPPKKEGDEIFDRLTTSSLNKHLGSYMQGLTAKVFRTYNASHTMSDLLKNMKSEGTIAEKVKDYNDANRKVAILCNHKRTVAAGHEGQMEKMTDRINGLRYQQWRLKQMILDIDPKMKKKKGADFFERPEDLTDEWVKEHQEALVKQEREKIEKKFAKDNEKRVADGQKEMKQKELDERLEAVDELAKKFKKENKSKKIEAEGKGPTVEGMEGKIEKLDQRIETMRVQAEDKDNNKEVALGTSKINYIDPRLTVVFSKKFNVPIERFFSKTLREKFDWAIQSVDENWEF